MSTPLGDFLRARRDATDPAAVGLSAGQRRRAPGLRRSELAALAGISVEYLVRIEQGRDRNPSVSVINALAEALRLDASERGHLHNGLLDGQYPNLTRFVFTDQRARRIFPEWERIADEAAFPLTFGAPSPRSEQLVADLTASAGPDFTRRVNSRQGSSCCYRLTKPPPKR